MRQDIEIHEELNKNFQGYKILLRADGIPKAITETKLSKVTATPAQFMNFDGKRNFEDKGYLATFEYGTSSCYNTNVGFLESIDAAFKSTWEGGGDYVHVILLPKKGVNEIATDSEGLIKEELDSSKFYLIYTSAAEEKKLSNINLESGERVLDPFRKIDCHEVLLCGPYPEGTYDVPMTRNDFYDIFNNKDKSTPKSIPQILCDLIVFNLDKKNLEDLVTGKKIEKRPRLPEKLLEKIPTNCLEEMEKLSSAKKQENSQEISPKKSPPSKPKDFSLKKPEEVKLKKPTRKKEAKQITKEEAKTLILPNFSTKGKTPMPPESVSRLNSNSAQKKRKADNQEVDESPKSHSKKACL